MLPLQTNGQANRGGAAVVRSGDDWGKYVQGHDRHRGNSELYKPGTGGQPGQVRLADGRCGGIDEQVEVEIAFVNKRLTMNLLILPGVVDSLVLGWDFLTQVGTEIRCAGHEVRIPARNRHNGWFEERLSVAVV
ncbi:uncharacterized protein LOC127012072 [Drosophila biarmipes]|uniref:uncharacterized protein LOC127012072 n=1 Tax=Drosophila biarmipes TaxID=125945 RepID=UPI0021CCC67F|nr:uncharacterized protein LOC127012072 [Drosophila biarmipes]